MKVKYFKETDTAYLEFSDHIISETKEINSDTYIDLDKNGNLVGLTIEHAESQTDFSEIIFEQIPEKKAV
jgi:uncharacterized protein YuzE